ncbi:MAG: MarR family transcriptional regulator [Myxococcaceae bacterium]|nr:MarR family transcriptional regulator [Myxococcaceae bacterium]
MADRPSEHPPLAFALAQELGRELSTRTILFHQAMADRVGLSTPDYRCLDMLHRAERAGPVTPGQLAQLTGLTTGGITGTLDRLEKAGFVRRERDPEDRRQIFVRTMPERMQELALLFEPFIRAMGELCARYSEKELELVNDYTSRVAKIIEQMTAELRAGMPAAAEPPVTESAELSAPLGEMDRASFEVKGGASNVTFVAGTGPFLYRARVTGPTPRITTQGGRVTMEYPRTAFRLFESRPHAVEVTLNSDIPWSLRINGGMQRLRAELSELRLAAVEVRGGADDVSLVLGAPEGTAPVRISGGANKVSVLRPQGVPVRFFVGSGAHKLVLDTLRLGAVGGETRWETPDFSTARDRYDMEVLGGASGVTLSTHSSSSSGRGT